MSPTREDVVTKPDRHDAFYMTEIGRLLLTYQNTAANANYRDAKADGEMTPEVREAWAACTKALDALIAALSPQGEAKPVAWRYRSLAAGGDHGWLVTANPDDLHTLKNMRMDVEPLYAMEKSND